MPVSNQWFASEDQKRQYENDCWIYVRKKNRKKKHFILELLNVNFNRFTRSHAGMAMSTWQSELLPPLHLKFRGGGIGGSCNKSSHKQKTLNVVYELLLASFYLIWFNIWPVANPHTIFIRKWVISYVKQIGRLRVMNSAYMHAKTPQSLPLFCWGIFTTFSVAQSVMSSSTFFEWFLLCTGKRKRKLYETSKNFFCDKEHYCLHIKGEMSTLHAVKFDLRVIEFEHEKYQY